MKISICIPTYNRKDLLRKALESSLRQTYQNIEIIVSDNCSNDGTKEFMFKEYGSNNKITYKRNNQNIGPLPNYKKCLYEYATGDYILFLSDDDELVDEKYIENAVQLIRENPNISIVIGNTRIVYSDLGLSYDEKKKLGPITSGKVFFLNYGTNDYTISWCNALFCRNQAIETKSYNGEVFYVDSDSFFRIMQFGDVGFVDTIASIYAVHAKNSYKIASLQTYLENQAYITRNYDYVLQLGEIDKDDLFRWRDRLLYGYRINMISNIILFSKFPARSLIQAIRILGKDGFHPSYMFYFKIPAYFLARFLTKIPFIFKFLVKYNHSH